MSENTTESEPKYEAFFDSDPDDPIQMFGWYPIPTEKIKNPEKIDEYIEQGLLREIGKANESEKDSASGVRVNARVSGTGDDAKGYKIFDMDYFDIALDDMPGKGKLIICKDPQNRIKEGNWAVVKQNDERGEKPPTAIALFWELAEAEKFAQKY